MDPMIPVCEEANHVTDSRHGSICDRCWRNLDEKNSPVWILRSMVNTSPITWDYYLCDNCWRNFEAFMYGKHKTNEDHKGDG